jgi:DNA-binding beta-propeller fold protein YncE
MPTRSRSARAIELGTLLALVLALSLALPLPALAGPPAHFPAPGKGIGGFDHACGVAVDSKGDVYVASAGESKVKIFDPVHAELASIPNSNEPCGLAVDSKGQLYVSEKATGKVVKYTPNAYPFSGTPTYGAPVTVDPSGDARGIAVDRFDDRLYVAEGDHISTYSPEGKLGIDEVQRFLVFEATGGTFKLSFAGQETGSLAWDASHATVQAALEGFRRSAPAT